MYYYAIYPNLLLSLHPDYMMIHTIWPETVDRTKIICEWYFQPAELAVDATPSNSGTRRTAKTGLCELSQAGIRSRAYTPGPYSKREALLHAFDRMIVELHASHEKRLRPERGAQSPRESERQP